MEPKQYHAGSFESLPPLCSDLQEILVKSEHDPALCFCTIEKVVVFGAWKVPAHPDDVVSRDAKIIDERFREILIREKTHLLGRDRIISELVRQVTRVGQAGE